MQSLEDVNYEEWSRTRLDRLLVDYLLRYGYKDSASALAKEKGIEELVDVETFVQMSRIRESLQNGRVTEALAWCNENKKELRRMEVCISHQIILNETLTKNTEQSRVHAPLPTIHRARSHPRPSETPRINNTRQEIPPPFP